MASLLVSLNVYETYLWILYTFLVVPSILSENQKFAITFVNKSLCKKMLQHLQTAVSEICSAVTVNYSCKLFISLKLYCLPRVLQDVLVAIL